MEDIDSKQCRGKLMLLLVNKAVRTLRDPRGSTLNDIIRCLECTFQDDRFIQDTPRLIPVIWRALNIGVNTGQLAITSDGRRFKIGPDFELDTVGSDRQAEAMVIERDEREGTNRHWTEQKKAECMEMNNNKLEVGESQRRVPEQGECERSQKRPRFFGRYEDGDKVDNRRQDETGVESHRRSSRSRDRKTTCKKRMPKRRKETDRHRGERADGRRESNSVWRCEGGCGQCDDQNAETCVPYCEPLPIPHVDVFS